MPSAPFPVSSGRLFTRSRIDRNGIKVMDGAASGSCAMFCGYQPIAERNTSLT